MDYDAIFAEYYPLYRGQATVPASTDREYQLGIKLANNAIRRWDRADGTLWNELYTTAQTETGQNTDLSVDTTVTNYSGPDNMRKCGSVVRLTDPSDSTRFVKLRVVSNGDIYAKSDNIPYAYFVGGANAGWVLYLVGNITSYNGWDIDYGYYKKPTLIEDGSTITEVSDPNFIIQSMLQSRFVNSRNGFAYNDAKEEATKALSNMVIENISGSPGNAWNLLETDQTPGFGTTSNTNFFRS